MQDVNYRFRALAVLVAVGLALGLGGSAAAQDDGTPTDPVEPPVDPRRTGAFSLLKYACVNLDETRWIHTVPPAFFPVEVVSEWDCAPGDATFVVTDAAGQSMTVSTGSEGRTVVESLALGEGTVVEVATGVEAPVLIIEASNCELFGDCVLTVVAFFNPPHEDGSKPVNPPPSDGGDDNADVDVVDTVDTLDTDDEAVEAADTGTVTRLPSTGQSNTGDNNGTIVLLLGALSLIMLAGGFAWRQRHAA